MADSANRGHYFTCGHDDVSISSGADVVRDGLGVELKDDRRKVVAEVFRCDADTSLTISLFAEELPFLEVEKLVQMARSELGQFEDGTPLPERI
jgi:hypothetical protein